jgi:hypothetical protein
MLRPTEFHDMSDKSQGIAAEKNKHKYTEASMTSETTHITYNGNHTRLQTFSLSSISINIRKGIIALYNAVVEVSDRACCKSTQQFATMLNSKDAFRNDFGWGTRGRAVVEALCYKPDG